jgi:hypothetical protein
VIESTACSRLSRAVKAMSENLRNPDFLPCKKCGEQLHLITKILDPRKGRIVHLLACKCGETTWIPEMT